MSNETEDKSSAPETPEPTEQPTEAVEEVVAEELDASIDGDIESDSVSDVLTEEITELKADLLRAHAEVQNARRRAEQDVEKARKFALEKFVSDLLPVADNLERAIAAGAVEEGVEQSDSQKAVLEGVELTLKSLQDTLKKYKVEIIDPQGEPFDPQSHQAMTMVPNPDLEPNTVMDVFQKGYTLNGRLVRPAMVVVSSAP